MSERSTERRKARRCLCALAGCVLFWAASGASCQRMVTQATAPMQRALPPSPTREQVFALVNDNTARVSQYYTTSATISSPMIPSLRASIALERPERFRMRAETPLTGPELDLGSNDDLFWFWVRRNQPAALYFCRHEEFAASPARRIIPVEPKWLIEALGLTSFSPEEEHRGPIPVGANRLRIETRRQTAGGSFTKVTVVDAYRGWVVEQHLYDAQGQLLATALTDDHRHDAVHNVTLPHRVQIKWPPAQISLRIDIRDLEINTLGTTAEHLWQKPSYEGFPDMDLGAAGRMDGGSATRGHGDGATR